MGEQTPETLNHFAVVGWTAEFRRLPPSDRHRAVDQWLERQKSAADTVHCYQLTGLEARGELLVWSACRTAEPERSAQFFSAWAEARAPLAGLVEVQDVLWGFTRPSSYTKVRSAQELDPFEETRRPFLIVYPFVKTAEWYRLPGEERQRLMSGHIKVGKQYKDISQLLLYSFGLQDQEFVVVYETDDLRRFLALVQELRSTEARVYTARDWPLHSGVYQSGPEALHRWL